MKTKSSALIGRKNIDECSGLNYRHFQPMKRSGEKKMSENILATSHVLYEIFVSSNQPENATYHVRSWHWHVLELIAVVGKGKTG